MKIYQKHDVLEGALSRIEYIISEFDRFGVFFSGGKDSTVTLNLVLQVAEKMGRLPVPVCFIDQEAEWQHTVDYVREVMNDPRVEPYWIQAPFRIFNAASTITEWLYSWDPDKEGQWMREKEPNSFTENVYGVDRFAELFTNISLYHFGHHSMAWFGGVRCEESPRRTMGLTRQPTYKHITYGKKNCPKHKHLSFYPLYDWAWRDIWKAIHDHGWSYCKIYDYMYQHGFKINEMRVSNLNHETALHKKWFVSEIEPDTWNKLVKRVPGMNTVKHMKEDLLKIPKELPEAFDSWLEYRDYLLHNIIEPGSTSFQAFAKRFAEMDNKYLFKYNIDVMYKQQITAMLVNDYHMTKLNNWETSPMVFGWRKWYYQGKPPLNKKNPFIFDV